MKKFIIFFSVLGVLSIFFFNNIVKAQENKLEECIYTNIDGATLIYEVDDEGNDTYNIFFKMKNQEYRHNIFLYQYVNYKDRQWICRTDLIEEASEVILLKLDISLASRTSYYIEMICMLAEDFSQIYRVTCLTHYDLKKILVSDSKNANEVLEIQALIEARFNYLTSLLDVEPYDSGIQEDEVLKTSMNQQDISYSYLQDNTKARNYEVFNNSAFLDQFVVCADDNIIEIIPIEVFFMNGPHLACGSGYGYYVNVMDETPSGDIKKCEVFVFEIKNYMEAKYDGSMLEIIPLFQQNFKAVTYSYDTSQIYSELFKISGKGRHVVSKGVDVPFFSISNPSETLLMDVIGPKEIGTNLMLEKGPCLSFIYLTVEDPKDYHFKVDGVDGNNLHNTIKNVIYYLSDFHPAISLASKIFEIIDVLSGYEQQIIDNRATLSRQYGNLIKLKFDILNYRTRSAIIGGNLNDTNLYIGEADDGTAVNKKERFQFQNVYNFDETSTSFGLQSLVTFCLNRYNSSIYSKYYSREKILAIQMELYINQSNDYASEIELCSSKSLIVNDNYSRLLKFFPKNNGFYNLDIDTNKETSICLYDNYGRILFDQRIRIGKERILLDLNSELEYYILVKSYGNSISINFNITFYSCTPDSIIKNNTYCFVLSKQEYKIYKFDVKKFENFTFTTYSNTDTKLYLYRNGIKIGYNDDYLYYQDDSDPDYNSQLDLRLNEGIYYVLVQNISSRETIYLEVT